MPATNFNTANQTWRQLMGNGLRYLIPRFQRDYSWDQDQWEDLWQDLTTTLDAGETGAHYMGYLVLKTTDNKAFEVIDGQQRLTTLSLVALTAIKQLDHLASDGVEPEANRQRRDALRNAFIGYLDPVTLLPRSKLVLNRHNDRYYQDFLVPLQPLPQRGRNSSENLLRRAFDWLLARLRELDGAKDGAEIARFLERAADALFFTVITVTDELNAFTVFETLNARGVRLSPTDLLKNYLFSVVFHDSDNAEEMEALERRWEALVGGLGAESFTGFLRVHWNSSNKLVRESDLFKQVRRSIHDRGGVFDLLRRLENDQATYTALANPEDTYWTPAERPWARLLRLFSVRQHWPLILAAARRLPRETLESLLRACTIISFRYNVIGGQATSEQERVYNDVALKIARAELLSERAVITALAPIYPSDERFRLAFVEKMLPQGSARNAKVARFILFELERHITGTSHDTESPLYTLEHVLPQRPEIGWEQFSTADLDANVDRLGNFTLLRRGDNDQAGRRPYAEKLPIYQASEFAITRRIAENNAEWTPARVDARQHWMANQATAIWRLAQLD